MAVVRRSVGKDVSAFWCCLPVLTLIHEEGRVPWPLSYLLPSSSARNALGLVTVMVSSGLLWSYSRCSAPVHTWAGCLVLVFKAGVECPLEGKHLLKNPGPHLP